MRLSQLLSLAALSFFFSTSCYAQANDTIHISELPTTYELTVPVSKLIMTLPKGGLSQERMAPMGGATASPHYFYFQDAERALIISGWFEPDYMYSGMQKIWGSELEALNKKGMPPQNITFMKIGNWDTVLYDVDLPKPMEGMGTNANIKAYWVQSGTWIDLHMSITSTNASTESRNQLIAMLKNIRISEK